MGLLLLKSIHFCVEIKLPNEHLVETVMKKQENMQQMDLYCAFGVYKLSTHNTQTTSSNKQTTNKHKCQNKKMIPLPSPS
jgi:hypothetical protein